MRKLRVLFCNEASYLSTGFATYGHEVLKRLHATGKFEIGEFAAYGDTSNPNDNRWRSIPWAFFPNMPNGYDKNEVDAYRSNWSWQFGEWKFEQAALGFRPDAIIDVRDFWMLDYQERSPFRRFYHWGIMPTCDASPQDEQWIATYTNADSVFAYSDWGLEQLKKQSFGRIKTICSAPPGADTDVFAPVKDKASHRQKLGMAKDAFVVGTIMRNQRRKLYPDLIQAFGLFLKTAPAELAKKTYLYIHTSYPDNNGWDIPRLIKEEGIGHKTIFTYLCQSCGTSYPCHFQEARAVCNHCGGNHCGFPNSQAGVSRKALAQILNTFDVYVQYANSEGFGMPQVEAASCGVPVMATDYSAMTDVVRKLKGYPIRVQRLTREFETHCWRALPDNADFVNQLIGFLQLPAEVRARRGYEARKAVETHYTYERTAKIWEQHLESIVPRDHATTWASPAKYHKPVTNVPTGLSDDEFVRWGMVNIAGRPDLLNSWMSLRMVRDLSWGVTGDGNRRSEYDRNAAIREMTNLCDQANHWEAVRTKS